MKFLQKRNQYPFGALQKWERKVSHQDGFNKHFQEFEIDEGNMKKWALMSIRCQLIKMVGRSRWRTFENSQRLNEHLITK